MILSYRMNLGLGRSVTDLECFEFESNWSDSKENGGWILLFMSLPFFAIDFFMLYRFEIFGVMSIVGIPLLMGALLLLNLRVMVRVEKSHIVSTFSVWRFKWVKSKGIGQYHYVRMSCRPPPATSAASTEKLFQVDLCLSKTPHWRAGDLDLFRYIDFPWDVDPDEYFSFVDKIVEVTGKELFAGAELPTKFKTFVKERYGDI